MPSTVFAAEHDALRDSVRRLVDSHLTDLAAKAEAGAAVQADAIVACRNLGLFETGDRIAEVVVAEELGRVRSGGLTALLLGMMAAADAGISAAVAAVIESSDVRIGDGAVSGHLPVVLAAGTVEVVLLLDAGVAVAMNSGSEASELVAPHALRGGAPGEVRLDGAQLVPSAVPAQVRRRHELRVAAAAVSAGWQTWHDATVYAGQRTAFGRPIARFQVNRHALADAATRLTGAEALVADTAWAVSQGREADTATVRLVAGGVAADVADVALQLHGGFGYTSEYDVQRAWRDAHALRSDDTMLRSRIAQGRPSRSGQGEHS